MFRCETIPIKLLQSAFKNKEEIHSIHDDFGNGFSCDIATVDWMAVANNLTVEDTGLDRLMAHTSHAPSDSGYFFVFLAMSLINLVCQMRSDTVSLIDYTAAGSN